MLGEAWLNDFAVERFRAELVTRILLPANQIVAAFHHKLECDWTDFSHRLIVKFSDPKIALVEADELNQLLLRRLLEDLSSSKDISETNEEQEMKLTEQVEKIMQRQILGGLLVKGPVLMTSLQTVMESSHHNALHHILAQEEEEAALYRIH